MDYIRGGLKLHFVVAIDFTTSNGLPNDPNSLHYWDRQRAENPYTVAIRSVGEIFQDYDVGMYVVLFLITHPWCHFLPWHFHKSKVFLKELKGTDSFNQIFCICTSDQYEYTKENFCLKKALFKKYTYKILFSFISPNFFGTFDDFSDFCSDTLKSHQMG